MGEVGSVNFVTLEGKMVYHRPICNKADVC